MIRETKHMKKKEVLLRKVGIISLGCDKNRVDTEVMLKLLNEYGFEITNEIEKANIIIINTCSFIYDAKKESVDAILESIGYKAFACEKVIVTGCITEVGLSETKAALPEVDAFVKVKDVKEIIKVIEKAYGVRGSKFVPEDKAPNRVLSTPDHYAYLKISDGCNNKCAFCAIPSIRGKYYSEPLDELVKEAKGLAELGVKEIMLVAQDVTRYGLDLYKKQMLVPLIKELSKIEGIKRIRLHYCYPEMVKEDLIKEIATNPKVCNYIDVPLQHINDKVLRNMNRTSTTYKILYLIKNLKKANPDITIRSTFIVGFPGETRRQFNELYEFVKDHKLNNVGFFAYSREVGTKAYNMRLQVPGFVKKHRLRKIQKLQQKIVNELNTKQVGKVVEVMCDGSAGQENWYVTRTIGQSPNVDPVTLVYSQQKLKRGKFYMVKITGYEGVDLKAVIINKG